MWILLARDSRNGIAIGVGEERETVAFGR